MTVVKVISALIALINIKLVSEAFSLQDYGTYAQAILLTTTVTSITILGMTDGVNFWYNNHNLSVEQRQSSVATLFGLQTIIGGLGGIAILLCGPAITEYFKNPALSAVYVWVAFQPLINNYLPMMQNLFVSIGKARVIVIRNMILSVVRLLIFCYACFVSKSVITILASCFIFDVAQTIYLGLLLKKSGVNLSFKLFDFKLIGELLKFCIPMAIAVILNSLLRDSDKWIVGYMGNTDEVAIYTNCSRVLPFDMLTTSFAVVLVPVITRFFSINRLKVAEIFNNYLNLCVITSMMLILPAIVMSRELLLTLYAPDYLPGLMIFIIYLFVDLIRAANITILFITSGNSKQLMVVAGVGLVLNILLAIPLYSAIGFIGPAVATILVMILSTIALFVGGSKIVGVNLATLFDFRRIGLLILEVIAFAVAVQLADNVMPQIDAIIKFIVFYVPAVALLALINRNSIALRMSKLNNIEKPID